MKGKVIVEQIRKGNIVRTDGLVTNAIKAHVMRRLGEEKKRLVAEQFADMVDDDDAEDEEEEDDEDGADDIFNDDDFDNGEDDEDDDGSYDDLEEEPNSGGQSQQKKPNDPKKPGWKSLKSTERMPWPKDHGRVSGGMSNGRSSISSFHREEALQEADAKPVVQISGVPKNYATLPFGRQIEFRHIIAKFKEDAKRGHIYAKRKSVASGFAEFKKLHNCTQWYYLDRTGSDFKDDTVEIWYK